ncbi:hypothetical protein [Xenophilus azovorans]|uniref:hypothetical protein n=1 Tax=Xenophilus azovorans TaxID=151755 RepID=UPI0012EE47E5|nr:hypothetical protein [Xenophilus azovorans]
MQWMFAALLALCSISHAQGVYRCGSAYSDVPCAGGRSVDVRPAVSDPDARVMADLYLCEWPNGARSWSQEHCGRRDAVIERVERVPADLPMHEQAEIANRQTRAGYGLLRRNSRVVASTPGTTQANASVCAALNEQVRALDAAARQPNPASVQDDIARRRKAARDEQFRLRC